MDGGYYKLFAGRLRKVKKGSGGNYTALCPFHDDRTPSFSFNSANGLWKCFAGCGGGNARQFLKRLGVPKDEIEDELEGKGGSSDFLNRLRGRGLMDLPDMKGSGFKGKGKGGAKRPSSSTSSKPKTFQITPSKEGSPPRVGDLELSVTYQYHDIDGNLLYLKDRYESSDGKDKTFRIRWVSHKHELVLYGLSQLDDTIDRIILTEGEKCAEAVREALSDSDAKTVVLGYNNFRQEFENSNARAYFEGRTVYVFADNDDTGRGKARAAIETLRSCASVVYLLDFAQQRKPEHYDIADYLAEGGDLYQAIADCHKVYEDPLFELALCDIPALQVDEIQYTGEFSIPIGTVGLLAGTGGVGKSYSALLMMVLLGIADGKNCLYVSLEDSKQIILQRLQRILRKLNQTHLPPVKIGIWNDVEQDQVIPLIEIAFRDKGYDFVFVDPIGSIFLDENDNAEVQVIMRGLNRLCINYNKNVILIHHLRKFEVQSDDRSVLYSAVRGATAIVNNCRIGWVFRRKKVAENKYSNIVEMVAVKNNYGPIRDYTIHNLFDDQGGIFVGMSTPGYTPTQEEDAEDEDVPAVAPKASSGRGKRKGSAGKVADLFPGFSKVERLPWRGSRGEDTTQED